jgi:pimeloyl-ACP methyl ester carboxylesterase
METSTCYPYKSEADKELAFSYLDSFAAAHWPVPSEQRTVPTRYGPTFVRISGPPAAAPVVLLHGAGSTSLMWAPNVEALSAHYRTYAVDQVGEFGKSLSKGPIRSFAALVEWLNELFDALQLTSRVTLAGMSYGGALAAQYALRFPARLSGVILLAPAHTVLSIRTAFWVRIGFAAVSKRRGMKSFLRWIFADMQRNDPAWVDSILEQVRINFRTVRPHRPVVPPVLTDAQWSSFNVPALFLVGERDVIYSARKAVERLKRVAPQIVAEIVPRAGHDLTLAQAQAVNRRILEFVAQHAAESHLSAGA